MDDKAVALADDLVAFAELAKRLDRIGVGVDTLTLNYAVFGSWELEVNWGYEAVRFLFDGRDGSIETEVSPVQKLSRGRQWKKVEAKGVSGRYPEAFAYVEGFLKDRFGKL